MVVPVVSALETVVVESDRIRDAPPCSLFIHLDRLSLVLERGRPQLEEEALGDSRREDVKR